MSAEVPVLMLWTFLPVLESKRRILLSLPATAIVLPDHFTSRTQPFRPVRTCLLVNLLSDQITAVWSFEPVAINLPSGDQHTLRTVSWCPLNCPSFSPVFESQRIEDPSLPQLTKRPAVGENETQWTISWWPARYWVWRVCKSVNPTLRSDEAVARNLISGLISMHCIGAECLRS